MPRRAAPNSPESWAMNETRQSPSADIVRSSAGRHREASVMHVGSAKEGWWRPLRQGSERRYPRGPFVASAVEPANRGHQRRRHAHGASHAGRHLTTRPLDAPTRAEHERQPRSRAGSLGRSAPRPVRPPRRALLGGRALTGDILLRAALVFDRTRPRALLRAGLAQPRTPSGFRVQGSPSSPPPIATAWTWDLLVGAHVRRGGSVRVDLPCSRFHP